MSELTVHHDSHAHDLEAISRISENSKFAMWLFIASETIIFSVFIAAYAVFRFNNKEIVHAVHEALGFSGTLIVTFNTFLLLTSSWAMVMGLRSIQLDNVKGGIRWLGITALLGTIFIGLQYYEYTQLAAKSITLGFETDAYEGFGMHFYAPTFFHGFHVFVGVLLCLEVIRRARKGHYTKENYVMVELFGLYWHFVDVVWILLFTLIYLV
ncbi:MAG: cytochrome c oxidase subunit 3 [bacterium]|nr:cytochrome c oxidase subunit 3 [bacterium]